MSKTISVKYEFENYMHHKRYICGIAVDCICTALQFRRTQTEKTPRQSCCLNMANRLSRILGSAKMYRNSRYLQN